MLESERRYKRRLICMTISLKTLSERSPISTIPAETMAVVFDLFAKAQNPIDQLSDHQKIILADWIDVNDKEFALFDKDEYEKCSIVRGLDKNTSFGRSRAEELEAEMLRAMAQQQRYLYTQKTTWGPPKISPKPSIVNSFDPTDDDLPF